MAETEDPLGKLLARAVDLGDPGSLNKVESSGGRHQTSTTGIAYGPHTYSHMTVHTGSAHTRTQPSPGQTQYHVKCMLLLLYHKVKEPVEPAQGLSESCSGKKDATNTAQVSP